MIDIEITITNGGSCTKNWIVTLSGQKYEVGTISEQSSTWIVEKYDFQKFCFNELIQFRCKDHFSALARGLVTIFEDYKKT